MNWEDVFQTRFGSWNQGLDESRLRTTHFTDNVYFWLRFRDPGSRWRKLPFTRRNLSPLCLHILKVRKVWPQELKSILPGSIRQSPTCLLLILSGNDVLSSPKLINYINFLSNNHQIRIMAAFGNKWRSYIDSLVLEFRLEILVRLFQKLDELHSSWNLDGSSYRLWISVVNFQVIRRLER